MGILCSFRLVLEKKRGKETRVIKIRVLRVDFNEQRCFIQKRTTPDHEKKRRDRFTFVENTITNSPNIARAKFLGIIFFISISKFDSFKNSLVTISSLFDLGCRHRKFILLVQTKQVISMSYRSSPSSRKP